MHFVKNWKMGFDRNVGMMALLFEEISCVTGVL
jgi:hypothetical protein